MSVDSHTTWTIIHGDHINDAVLPAVPLEEPVRVTASTSVSPDIQAPSLPQDTPDFQVPSHAQHEDILPQLTEDQKEEVMRIHTELTSRENPVDEVTSFEFEEPRDQTAVYNAIFKEPPREPQDKADLYNNAIWGEPQGESDDSKSISEEESDQEEWTPQGKSKQGRPIAKSNVNSIELLGESDQEEWTPQGKRKQGRPKSKGKRKYTKRNSAKTQDSEGS